MTSPLPRVLVAGVSVRSLARSAIAAGYDVLTADGYGDRDLLEPVPGPARHLTVSPFEPGCRRQSRHDAVRRRGVHLELREPP